MGGDLQRECQHFRLLSHQIHCKYGSYLRYILLCYSLFSLLNSMPKDTPMHTQSALLRCNAYATR